MSVSEAKKHLPAASAFSAEYEENRRGCLRQQTSPAVYLNIKEIYPGLPGVRPADSHIAAALHGSGKNLLRIHAGQTDQTDTFCEILPFSGTGQAFLMLIPVFL